DKCPLREDLLRAIAAGRHLTTLAFSERGSRSHFWMPISQAVAAGPSHRLSAEKSFVTSAGHADSYLVSTRAADQQDPMASTIHRRSAGLTGLTVSGPWNGLGLRGNASAPMTLKAVEVPASHRVSGEGNGFTVMLNIVLPWFQLGSAAVSVGIAQAALEGT